MTRPLLTQADMMARAARSNSSVNVSRALRVAEDKVGMFTKLVPWPALAESFARDVERLRAAAGRKRAALESMA